MKVSGECFALTVFTGSRFEDSSTTHGVTEGGVCFHFVLVFLTPPSYSPPGSFLVVVPLVVKAMKLFPVSRPFFHHPRRI